MNGEKWSLLFQGHFKKNWPTTIDERQQIIKQMVKSSSLNMCISCIHTASQLSSLSDA